MTQELFTSVIDIQLPVPVTLFVKRLDSNLWMVVDVPWA